MEIDQLIYQIKTLQIQKTQLQQTIQHIQLKLQNQRKLWNEQHCKLIDEIQKLRENIGKIQSYVEQIEFRNHQLQFQNHEFYQQIQYFTVNSNIKQRQESCFISFVQKQNSRQKDSEIQQEFHKIQQEIDAYYSLNKEQTQEKDRQNQANDKQNLHKICTKDINPKQFQQFQQNYQFHHNLRQQLKNIQNLQTCTNDPYKQDAQSSFTIKYFKYKNDSDHQFGENCFNAYQEEIEGTWEEEDFFDFDEEEDDFVDSLEIWVERLSCFMGGTCLGAYLLWKMKK